MNNEDRVGSAMYRLRDGLTPFVGREFIKYHQGRSPQELRRILNEPVQDAKERFPEMDVADLLKVMERSWNQVFQRIFDRGERNTGRAERALVLELQEVRNRPAHQRPFSSDDAYRALDSTYRLLAAVSASKEADEVERMKMEVLRVLCGEQDGVERPTLPIRPSRPRNWAEKGTINSNRQENLGRVEPQRQSPKTYQYIHRMKCLECGWKYYTWSADIPHRKCPYHDNGAPGPDLTDGTPT